MRCSSGIVIEGHFKDEDIYSHAFVPTFFALIHAFLPGFLAIISPVFIRWAEMARFKSRRFFNFVYFAFVFFIIVWYEGLEIFVEDYNLFICKNSRCTGFWSTDWLHESVAKKFYDIVQGTLSISASLVLINLAGAYDWKTKDLRYSFHWFILVVLGALISLAPSVSWAVNNCLPLFPPTLNHFFRHGFNGIPIGLYGFIILGCLLIEYVKYLMLKIFPNNRIAIFNIIFLYRIYFLMLTVSNILYIWSIYIDTWIVFSFTIIFCYIFNDKIREYLMIRLGDEITAKEKEDYLKERNAWETNKVFIDENL